MPEIQTHVVLKKIIVFEKSKQRKISDNIYCQQNPVNFPKPVDQKPCSPVKKNGKQHQQNIDRFPPGIKKQTWYQQQDIFTFWRNNIISSNNHRQKEP